MSFRVYDKRKAAKVSSLYRASKQQCRNKVKYQYVEDAWCEAAHVFITLEKIQMPYRCDRTGKNPHYHLTSKAAIGDLTHIPPQYRELFSTHDQVIPESFFSKLRRVVVGEKAYE